MNKKGIELSVNFIVMLLIALVIFGFGLKIGYTLFFQAEDTANKLNKDVEKGLMDALTSKSKVSIPESIFKMKRGDSKSSGVGVYNVLDGPETFVVDVQRYKYYETADSDGDDFEGNWNLNAPSAELKPNEKKVFSIPFKVPNDAKRGTYVFNVKVCMKTCGVEDNEGDVHFQDNDYGGKHQIMLNVN